MLDEEGKDQVMLEGFMQAVRDLLNVDLDRKASDLPKYTREDTIAIDENTVDAKGVGENGIGGRIRRWFRAVSAFIRRN